MSTTDLATIIQTLQARLTPDEQTILVNTLVKRQYYTNDQGTVFLGHKATADAQYAADEAAGGLVALAMRWDRHMSKQGCR